MIEPVKSGPELLEEIAATAPGPDSLALWWLGQSGFLIKSADTTILVDPYLSEHLTTKYANTDRPHVRMTRAPLRASDLTGVDLVLCSHKHSDHLDPGTLPDLLTASPRALVILPRAIIPHALELGIPADRLIGLDAHESWLSANERFIVVGTLPALHETFDVDESGRYPYLGFVVNLAGLCLYHSGDCLTYEGIAAYLAGSPIDVAFLPINGRDPSRGVAGNMSAAEAVDLANELKCRFVVPHHYDMFKFNTVPVADFETEARRLSPGIKAKVLRCGELWEVGR
jgi:L-ascorbate 6-phosphate lactonase